MPYCNLRLRGKGARRRRQSDGSGACRSLASTPRPTACGYFGEARARSPTNGQKGSVSRSSFSMVILWRDDSFRTCINKVSTAEFALLQGYLSHVTQRFLLSQACFFTTYPFPAPRGRISIPQPQKGKERGGNGAIGASSPINIRSRPLEKMEHTTREQHEPNAGGE